MNNERPCECGCSFKDHEQIILQKEPEIKSSVLYCKECNNHPESWCYNYKPIGNLEYLEWKYNVKS